MHSLVLTLIGKDRPGLVEAVSTIIQEQGGNWAQSRMCHLGGQFAGLLRVEIDPLKADTLRQRLSDLEGLNLVVHDTEAGQEQDAERAVIELVGVDRPGIVQRITRALAHHGVNVEDFSSDQSAAPMSGGTLFTARVEVRIPAQCDLSALDQELEKIAADLMFEITLAAPLKAS